MGEDYEVEEIPADLQEKAAEYREKLLERVAESDDELMEKYLGGEELSVEELKAASASSPSTPRCTRSLRLRVQEPRRAADARRRHRLPAEPAGRRRCIGHALDDEDEIDVTRAPSKDEPFSALAFKIAAHPFFGKLTFVRVYSGRSPRARRCSTRPRARRSASASSSRCTPTRRTRSTRRWPATSTRHRSQGHHHRRHPVRPEQPDRPRVDDLPGAGHQGGHRAKTKADQEKLGTAIQKLAEEDPTFQVELDEETGQTIIAGMGELHLDILVDRMRREFKVEANVGKPQVAYRETIRAPSRSTTTPTRSRPVGRASSRRSR
jgi:elongation factor G